MVAPTAMLTETPASASRSGTTGRGDVKRQNAPPPDAEGVGRQHVRRAPRRADYVARIAEDPGKDNYGDRGGRGAPA